MGLSMDCVSRAYAMLKHGFSTPKYIRRRQIYAWEFHNDVMLNEAKNLFSLANLAN
jgi:hypothetical protein